MFSSDVGAYYKMVLNQLKLCFFFLFLLILHVSSGDVGISPYPNAVVKEYGQVTLTCTYSGSATLIYWVQNTTPLIEYAYMISTCQWFAASKPNGTDYQHSCTNSTFTWTFLNVRNQQHGERWNCRVNDASRTESFKTEIFVEVRVTSVELQRNNVPVTGNLTLTAGVPETLTCEPGISRPSPTINWYIDRKEVFSSTQTEFNLNASDEDHQKELYCKAYNIQPEDEAVQSVKVSLFVQVPIASVQLKKNSSPVTQTQLTVTVGTDVSLSCTPGTGYRPSTVTVDWYIGPSNKVASDRSTFTYSPSNGHNNLTIYCKAYNLQSVPAVESAKPTLYVQVPIASVQLKKNNIPVTQTQLTVTVGTDVSLSCTPGTGYRPSTITVDWYIGSTKVAMDRSTFTYRPSDGHNNLAIYCKAYNLQSVPAVESAKPTLYVRVPIASVQLNKNNSPVTQTQLTVTVGTDVSLSCTPGAGYRPLNATIDWYIGPTNKVASDRSTFTYSPSNGHNNLTIYCKAYNLQSVPAVESAKPTLYVQVKVTSVQLKLNNSPVTQTTLTVTAGTPVTLSCTPTPGYSRPSPTIQWYKGSSSAVHIGLDFSYTPSNSDHDNTIYCKAYNLQQSSEAVESAKPKIYVRVESRAPSFLSIPDSLLDGDTYNLKCQSTPTRPPANITWKLGNRDLTKASSSEVSESGGLVSVISTVSYVASKDDHNSQLLCQSKIQSQSAQLETRKTVTIWWQPRRPTITPISRFFPWLEGQIGTLQCITTDSGNPKSSVTWTSSGTTNAQGQRVIGPLTYRNDQQDVVCKLENQFTTTKRVNIFSTIQLQVQYSPRITIQCDGETAGSTTVIESKAVSCECTAIGNPQPSVSWTGVSSGGWLSISDVHRTQAGNYICRAAATSTVYPGHDFTKEGLLKMIVHYPPDVSVSVSGLILENESLALTCLPDGLPAEYSYHRWTQVWSGSTISSNQALQSSSTIIIPSLQLQDSGNYTCSVDNKIPDRDNTINQFGTTEVIVKVTPKFFMHEPLFAGNFSENITVSIPFYSYPKYQSYNVTLPNGTISKVSSKHMLAIEETIIETAFHKDNSVYLNGYRANFTIINLEENDFAEYHLNVVNDMGPEEVAFTVISESKPRQPTEFHLVRLEDNTAHLVWTRGFNGGRTQTFLLQLSNKGLNNWSNRTVVEEFDEYSNLGNTTYRANITDIKPGSYSVQLVAFNSIDRADPLLLSTTIDISETGPPGASTFPIGAAVGGGLGAAVLIIVILVVVFRRRLLTRKDDYKKSIISPKRKAKTQDNSDVAEVNLNPMYESADEVQGVPVNDIYAKVNKPLKTPELGSSGDVYSQVNKPKKGDTNQTPTVVATSQDLYSTPVKKGKDSKGAPKSKPAEKKGKGKDKKVKKQKDKNKEPEKQIDGTVYENADTLSSRPKDPDMNVYENPNCSTSDEKPNRTRNEDGLIYIDVEIPKQNGAMNLKPVIHGLDDRTIYADVAYGQVGEQLPESDEEGEKPKE